MNPPPHVKLCSSVVPFLCKGHKSVMLLRGVAAEKCFVLTVLMVCICLGSVNTSWDSLHAGGGGVCAHMLTHTAHSSVQWEETHLQLFVYIHENCRIEQSCCYLCRKRKLVSATSPLARVARFCLFPNASQKNLSRCISKNKMFLSHLV